MNTSQGILLILATAVAAIVWVRVGSARDAARADQRPLPSSPDGNMPVPRRPRPSRSEAWLSDVAAWGEDIDGTAVTRRQASAIAQGEIYASVSADKAAQLQRVGEAA